MCDQQDRSAIESSNRLPSGLAVNKPLLFRHGILIQKHSNRFIEIDPVFSAIQSRLVLVPFEALHRLFYETTEM